MNASYNASIRCVNFSVTLFFPQGLVVKHGLFNILNVKIDCTISMTFQKAPKVNEHWVHVQNCSLLSGFHLQ